MTSRQTIGKMDTQKQLNVPLENPLVCTGGNLGGHLRGQNRVILQRRRVPPLATRPLLAQDLVGKLPQLVAARPPLQSAVVGVEDPRVEVPLALERAPPPLLQLLPLPLPRGRLRGRGGGLW